MTVIRWRKEPKINKWENTKYHCFYCNLGIDFVTVEVSDVTMTILTVTDVVQIK